MIDSSPYKSPETTGGAVRRSPQYGLWAWSACSVTASLLSLALFYLYGHWHWHRGPWEATLPGQLGLTWIAAVDGSKACSALLAVLSLCITVAIFRKKGYVQGLVTLPTCLLSVMTVGVVT